MKDYADLIEVLLKKYGRRVTVIFKSGEEITTGAVVQPLLYKNKLYVELQPSEVGRVDDGCCRYIGPADVEFESDDSVKTSDKTYTVQRFEKFYMGDKPLYSWAILRPCVVPSMNNGEEYVKGADV